MEARDYGELTVFPKELKFSILSQLDTLSLGRLMQTNKVYSTLPNDIGLWKYLCVERWSLSAEKIQSLAQVQIDWKREYRILEHFSRCIFNNQLFIRPEDTSFARPIDTSEPNSLHFFAHTDQTHTQVPAIAAQGQFQVYPQPLVNFSVGYFEVTVAQLGPDEPMIGIGIALNKYARGMPGWGKDSYGVHSDDGCVYSQCESAALPCTAPWHEGDTLGMGINYATKSLFVTRNGLLLDTIAQRVRNLSHMHVTVAVQRVDTKCRVNFGQRPFMFDLVEYLRTLEADPAINSKWPFKLYSYIVQELEETALDSESLDEVDPEVISANYYYEDDFAPSMRSQSIIVDNNDRDLEEDQREVTLALFFAKLSVLNQGHIAEGANQDRPEIKKIVLGIVESLQLEIDHTMPLPQMINNTQHYIDCDRPDLHQKINRYTSQKKSEGDC